MVHTGGRLEWSLQRFPLSPTLTSFRITTHRQSCDPKRSPEYKENMAPHKDAHKL